MAKYNAVPIFQQILYKIGAAPMRQVWWQYTLAYRDYRNWLEGTPQSVCSGRFTRQWGLPCKHLFFQLLLGEYAGLQREDDDAARQNSLRGTRAWVLTMEDFDKHWWLYRDGSSNLTEEEVAQQQYKDPLPLVGRRRKAAIPKRSLNATIRGQSNLELLDPDPYNRNAASQKPAGQQPKRDQEMYDNRRIPSHDEPAKPKAKAKRGRKSAKEKAEELIVVAQEAQRVAQEAAKEAQREAQEVAKEAQREAQEARREAQEAAKQQTAMFTGMMQQVNNLRGIMEEERRSQMPPPPPSAPTPTPTPIPFQGVHTVPYGMVIPSQASAPPQSTINALPRLHDVVQYPALPGYHQQQQQRQQWQQQWEQQQYQQPDQWQQWPRQQ